MGKSLQKGYGINHVGVLLSIRKQIPSRGYLGYLTKMTLTYTESNGLDGNPFNGGGEGVLTKVDIRRIPADEPANAVGYVFDLLT